MRWTHRKRQSVLSAERHAAGATAQSRTCVRCHTAAQGGEPPRRGGGLGAWPCPGPRQAPPLPRLGLYAHRSLCLHSPPWPSPLQPETPFERLLFQNSAPFSHPLKPFLPHFFGAASTRASAASALLGCQRPLAHPRASSLSVVGALRFCRPETRAGETRYSSVTQDVTATDFTGSSWSLATKCPVTGITQVITSNEE